MRKRIDAHVHIVPADVLGTKNPRFALENLPFGLIRAGQDTFHNMPCYIHDSQFTAQTLINLLDVYGVEKAVILQSLMAEHNREIAQAVQQYPDRLAGAMVLEPLPGWEKAMEHWRAQGLSAIKFEMRAYTKPGLYPDARYDDPQMTAFFDKADQLGLTVVIDPAPVDFPVYCPQALEKAVASHPNVNFVLCHLGYPCPLDTPEREARWEQMVDVVRLPNCWVDLSAMPDFFDAEGWPYPTAQKLIARVKERCGIQKLIWGTDTPGTLNRATYPQMIEMFERGGFTPAELDALFYENAMAAYRL